MLIRKINYLLPSSYLLIFILLCIGATQTACISPGPKDQNIMATTTTTAAENITLSSEDNTMPVENNQAAQTIRPEDDFYEYVNGKWLNSITIPEDKSSWGAFNELQESTTQQLRQVIENLATDKTNDVNKQKIYAMYQSFMDEKKLESLEAKPLEKEMSTIDQITDKKEIPALIAHLNKIGVTTPISIFINQDAYNSSKEAAYITQNGLGLPDRDYYLKADDENLKIIKQKYLGYIDKMLKMYGDENSSIDAGNIVNLETELAKIQWTNVQNRDPVKTYNKFGLDQLTKVMPNYNWANYLTVSDLKDNVSYIIIAQPSYFEGLDQLLQNIPLSVWKIYFKWQLLNEYAPLLSKAYDDTHFAFNGTVLAGIPKQEPRYKRAITSIEASMGEALGQLYVAQYFPPKNKARVEKLVENLIQTFDKSINSLDWMSDATKIRAKTKLMAIRKKIAYPDKWRDYSALVIKPDDLVGNIMRANKFEYERQINKLSKPVDRTEWLMTPQMINAYYSPEQNEIVFPAAILQPPFFDINADDAYNYGGIGAVIGHEISHAFDDQGSQYDENGNLNNWWTDIDRKKFADKTSALVKQYSLYSPLPGYNINGALTLGENIADNSGLAIAFKAYRFSLQQQAAPIINGITGDERFYRGWVNVWRTKIRDPQIIQMIKTNPHSPPKFRGNGALRNQPGFYDALHVKPGDKMYLPPEERVIIW